MRVLIAEDDPDIASGQCASLRRQGHLVDHVDNGAHADAALGSTQYALLILDLAPPQPACSAVPSASAGRVRIARCAPWPRPCRCVTAQTRRFGLIIRLRLVTDHSVWRVKAA